MQVVQLQRAGVAGTKWGRHVLNTQHYLDDDDTSCDFVPLSIGGDSSCKPRKSTVRRRR